MMKLFKKLAAVALAAVLALSMVGCGAANAGPSYKTELVNLMKDLSSVNGGEYTVENTSAMDNAAKILLQNVQKEYNALDADAQKTVTGQQITGWLTDEAALANAKLTSGSVSFAGTQSFASNMFNTVKDVLVYEQLLSNEETITDDDNDDADVTKLEVGFAQGKLGDKSIIVVVSNGELPGLGD